MGGMIMALFELNPYEDSTTIEIAEAVREPLRELIVKETNVNKRAFLEKVLSTLRDWYA
jgi:hypothetical protein